VPGRIVAMQMHRKLITILAMTAPALLVAAPAGAARTTDKTNEAFYRCRDQQGRAYVGQSIPEECLEQDIEVIDTGGRVVRVIPGRKSLEGLEARKAADDARLAAANHDRTLLATYLSVADIERLRDQRVELLVQQALVTDQYIVNLQEREARLSRDVQRFRPYSDKRRAPPLPDHIAEDIVNTVNGLQVYRQELAKNTAEQKKLLGEFNSDIARFKELKGIR